MKKNLCIMQNGLKYGGTDTFVLNLINNLSIQSYNIFLVLSGDNNDILREDELKGSIKVYKTCSLNGLKNKANHLKQLYKILKKEKIEIFETNVDLFNGLNIFVAWLANVKVRVCHSHNAQQAREIQNGRNIAIKVYQFIMKKLCWLFSNRRSGCSALAMDFLFDARWKEDPRSFIIYNGIDIDKFKVSVDIEEKKRELGLKAQKNILIVGRIDIQKNPEFIIDVFYNLCQKNNYVDLVWVGTGEMKDEIEASLKIRGIYKRIHFLGKRDDVNEIMKCCDLFFLPSNFEGFGIVLIEAQAAGLSCVTSTNVPKETNCGMCHYLDLKEDIEVWTKIIIDMLENNDDIIDEYLLNQFTIKKMVKKMDEVF